MLGGVLEPARVDGDLPVDATDLLGGGLGLDGRLVELCHQAGHVGVLGRHAQVAPGPLRRAGHRLGQRGRGLLLGLHLRLQHADLLLELDDVGVPVAEARLRHGQLLTEQVQTRGGRIGRCDAGPGGARRGRRCHRRVDLAQRVGQHLAPLGGAAVVLVGELQLLLQALERAEVHVLLLGQLAQVLFLVRGDLALLHLKLLA